MEQLSSPSHLDPIPGYRFVVYLNGLVMGFQKVSGMAREIETESYREGGLNTRVHVFPKYCGSEQILRLEKGICSSEGHLFYQVGNEISGALNLVVMDSRGKPLVSYLFSGMIVRKWEIGELSAEQNNILIDHFEVSYEEFQLTN